MWLLPGLHPDHAAGRGTTLGILAFETSRTMSRLISLHRSLSDPELDRLRSHTMTSVGVAYLNSPDQSFLSRLACAEMLDDLDRAAAAISRLCRRCHGVWPRGFDHVYADLKAGVAEIGHLELGLQQPREVAKRVKRMEIYVAATSALLSEMQCLAEMEVSDLTLQRWKNSGNGGEKPNTDLFRKKLVRQRRRVRRLREESLWSQSFGRVGEIMATAAVSAFARICIVFGPYVSELSSVLTDGNGRLWFVPHRQLQSSHHHRAGSYSSGPLERPVAETVTISNSGPILRTPAAKSALETWKKEVLDAPPSTLGASGLALRYANVIVLAEKMARSPESVGEGAREELYHMLPVGLRASVRAKLRSCRKMESGQSDDDGELLASGWREAVDRILGWLAPMAQDMMQWQLDRSYEHHRSVSGPRVLLLQTLWFSDKEKAEAAIVEVLVGLSYICRYQQSVEEEIGSELGR